MGEIFSSRTGKPTGYAVLNADDSMTVEVAKRLSGSIIYFSEQEDNLILRRHINLGGRGVYVKNGVIYFEQEGNICDLIRVKDIPATLKGLARHNLQNALAAAAGAWGLNIPAEVIANALGGFHCDKTKTQGE